MATSPRGQFITLEGIEGAGKSTQQAFIIEYLQQRLPQAVIKTREPGGTIVAEAIRQTVLQHYDETMCDDSELLLLFAARAQHLQILIKPSLQKGHWVVCDRFTDASYAYQGGGRGISDQRLQLLESWVQQGLQPDLTILLDVPAPIAIARIQSRKHFDRIEIEQQEFFNKVRAAYLKRAQAFPERIKVCDASQDTLAVQDQIVTILKAFLTL